VNILSEDLYKNWSPDTIPGFFLTILQRRSPPNDVAGSGGKTSDAGAREYTRLPDPPEKPGKSGLVPSPGLW